MSYVKYYKTENLFGQPYPVLMEFFENHSERNKVLDLGCGQGRDAIALARIGYKVTGIDNSKLGIEQMNLIAKNEGLPLIGKVQDIYKFDDFSEFDILLLDSMFHFEKKDFKKETDFIKKMLSKIRNASLVVFCIQDSIKKYEVLNQTINHEKQMKRLLDTEFEYVFEDSERGHQSKTNYRMLVIEK